MRFIRGHNSTGMDRSKPYKTERYTVEDRGYNTPCWIWQLKKTRPNKRGGRGGYGVLRAQGKEHLAHRWYYEKANGPIEDGNQLDHLCRVRECVNPEHLEPVTPLENARRSRSTKLTLAHAKEIERYARMGIWTQDDIAEHYGVSRQTVSLIALNGADGPRRPRSALAR